MLHGSFERAILLFQQGRYEMAATEFRAVLTGNPEFAQAHALLALCLLEQEKFKEATEEAQVAIGYAPDDDLGFRALGHIMLQRNQFEEALAAARQAVELGVESPENHALLASVQFHRRDWPAALEAANRGLEIDPEDVDCQNLRAMALVKLGRRDEAGQTIGAALSRDPDNSVTHANQGWALLHGGEGGQPRQALEHFREALRLDPNNEWARMGIVEALKSRNIVYRLLLRYFLWMGRLSHRAQWGIIIGAFLLYQVLRGIARQNPDLRIWIYPIIGLYIAFAVMTWLADPLFNLLLRLNRFGRLVLSRDQVVMSNWIGGLILTALVCWAVSIPGPNYIVLFSIVSAFMIIPVHATFKAAPGWPRKWTAMFATALGAIGLAMATLGSLGDAGIYSNDWAFDRLLMLFFIGAILSPWVANAMMQTRPRR